MDNTRFELIVVKIVRLAEELELPVLLGGDDRLWTATKTAVVDAGDGGVVVGEFRLDFGIGDINRRRKFGLFGYGGIAVIGAIESVDFVVVISHGKRN